MMRTVLILAVSGPGRGRACPVCGYSAVLAAAPVTFMVVSELAAVAQAVALNPLVAVLAALGLSRAWWGLWLRCSW